MIAEEVLRGLLVVSRRPITFVVLKVGGLRVREIGRAAKNIVVNRRQIVAGGEHVVQVVAVIAAVLIRIILIIAAVLIRIILIVAALIVLIAIVLTIVLIVVAAVITSITPAVSKISAVAKIVAHSSSNDGCFADSRVSTWTLEKK